MIGISKEIYDKAFADGVKQGRAEGREEVVLALLRDGRISPEEIAEIFGITLEDVLAIRDRALS